MSVSDINFNIFDDIENNDDKGNKIIYKYEFLNLSFNFLENL